MVNPEADNYVPTDWSHPLEELKHSLRLYLDFSGGVNPELGSLSLKLIDILDDLRDHKSPAAELQHIATILIKSLVDVTQHRLELLDSKEGDCVAKSIATNKNQPPKNDLHAKQYYLLLLSQSCKDLSRLTNKDYPEITNLDGDKL